MYMLLTLLFSASTAYAVSFLNRGVQLPPPSGPIHDGIFWQPVDHDDPSTGVFAQRYLYSIEHWNGSGYPVIFTTPGESPLLPELFSPNLTISQLAKQMGAAIVQLEHRFFGDSVPSKGNSLRAPQASDFSPSNLKYLTVEKAIADFANFAQTSPVPFDEYGTNNASTAPWVFIGSSYAGSLAAWTDAVSPGTFWAYWASSAPVQVVDDYWQYQTPIRKGMPQNCRTDIELIVDELNAINEGGHDKRVKYAKNNGILENDIDGLADMLKSAADTWQQDSRAIGRSLTTDLWCGSIERRAGSSCKPVDAVGLTTARRNMISLYKGNQNATNPFQAPDTVSEFDNRAYFWLLCNQPLHDWQDAAPYGLPSLWPSTYNVTFWQGLCDTLFLDDAEGITYNQANGSANNFNLWTGGWNPQSNSDRLLFVNGEFDPWREASVSSHYRPGGPMESSQDIPVSIVPGGHHGEDLFYSTTHGVPQDMLDVIDAAINQTVRWVEEWKSSGHEKLQASQETRSSLKKKSSSIEQLRHSHQIEGTVTEAAAPLFIPVTPYPYPGIPVPYSGIPAPYPMPYPSTFESLTISCTIIGPSSTPSACPCGCGLPKSQCDCDECSQCGSGQAAGVEYVIEDGAQGKGKKSAAPRMQTSALTSMLVVFVGAGVLLMI